MVTRPDDHPRNDGLRWILQQATPLALRTSHKSPVVRGEENDNRWGV